MTKIPLSLLFSRLSCSTPSASPHIKDTPDPLPSSDAGLALYYVHVSVVLWNLKLDHLPPADILIDAANETVDLGSVGMLLDPSQLAIQQEHWVPSAQIISSQLGSRMNLVQDFIYPFMRFLSTQFSILLRFL